MVLLNTVAFARRAQELPPFVGSKGSIVRLKIRDFMTYHFVEMTAGPNVNLVMGPNGTGKSTIVCAICLGLAGKPKFLGRAHSLKEYIRHGAKNASVEIELHGGDDDPNWIIRRDIQETRTGASSDWFLNNQKVPENQIMDLMVNLNVQLDNLCQFLPQDRVQEFAKMDSVQLLENTEKSIDTSTGLQAKHAKLKELQEEIKQLDISLNKLTEALRIETAHTNRMENEVQAFNERQELLQKKHEAEGKKLWLMYVKAMDDFHEVSEKLKVVQKQKQDAEKLIAPLKKEIDSLSQKLQECKQTLSRKKHQYNSGTEGAKRNYRDTAENAETQIVCYNAQLESVEKNENDRIRRVNERNEQLRDLENEYEELRNRGDCDDFAMNQLIRECDEEYTRYTNKIFEIDGADRSDQGDIGRLTLRKNGHEAQWKAMNEFRNSRMHFLERHTPYVAKAVKFFFDVENESVLKQRLKGKIHEPMILHMNVNDLAYGNVAEKHIPPNDLTAFFCEEKEDVQTLIAISLEKGWRVSCIHHAMDPNFVKPPSIWNEEYQRAYDFQGNLIDLLEAPDYYMSYLCKSAKPQEILIGTGKTDALATEIMNNTQLRYYYTKKHCVAIRTSFYTGKKNCTTSYLNNPRIFTAKINAVEQEQLQASIKELELEIEQVRKRITVRQPELTRLQTLKTEVEQRKKEIQIRIDYIKKISSKIQISKNYIATHEAEKQDVEKYRKDLEAKKNVERMKQLEAIEKFARTIKQLEQTWVEAQALQRQVRLVNERVEIKQNEYEDAKVSVDQYLLEIETLDQRKKTSSETAKRRKVDARAKTNQERPPDDVIRKEVDEDTLSRDISRFTAQLNFLPDTDESVIREFEARQRKMIELKKLESVSNNDISLKRDEMMHLKIEWLEPLQNLVERINTNFSHFFQTMRCVGEVSLDKGEDENNFFKYGIKIKVKFRSNEPLVDLCGWKQSGGERAITTALYILALQELTKVPFRVIDEINQGMDANNEARFFRLLCSLARGEDTPQYFLLTPKMLPPVEYPGNVDFHIIFNGPHVKINQEKPPLTRNRVAVENSDEESEGTSSG